MSKTALLLSASAPALKARDPRSTPPASRSAAGARRGAQASPTPSGTGARRASLLGLGGINRPNSSGSIRPGPHEKLRISRPHTALEDHQAISEVGSPAASPSNANGLARSTSSSRLRLPSGTGGKARAAWQSTEAVDSLAGTTSSTSSALVTGLAPATWKENRKAEKLEEKISRTTTAAEITAEVSEEPRVPGTDATTVQPGANFEEDLKLFEVQVEELGRNIRMEHFMEAIKNAADADKRDEERKRQRERERKQRDHARETEQAANNPRRRVALRLERSRDVGVGKQVEIGGNTHIPLQKHLVMGGSSPERLEMVNVVVLQGRCLGLSSSGASTSYKSLCEFAEMEEKRHLWEASSFSSNASVVDHVKTNSLAGGDSIRSRTWAFVSSKMSRQEQRNEAHRLQVQERRKQHAAMKSRQKEMDLSCRCTSNALTAIEESRHSTAARMSECICAGQDPEQRRSLPHTPLAKLNARSSVRSIARLSLRKSGLQAPVIPLARTGRALWRVARSVLYLLVLLRLVQTRHRSVDVLRKFIGKYRDYMKLKVAVLRFIDNLRNLQGHIRLFLAKKRRWCQDNIKQWIQYEDQYLQACFKPPAPRSDENETRRGERRKARVEMAPPTDWRVFRVPPYQRRFTLGRWYIAKARRMVQRKEYWMDMIKMAVQQHRDIQGYFTLCGRTDSATNSGGEDDAEPPLAFNDMPAHSGSTQFDLGEQETVELVKLAVSELIDVPPFQNHPANQTDTFRLEPRVSGRMRRILKKQEDDKMAASKKQLGIKAAGKPFSIDTMEQLDFSDGVGGDYSKTNVEDNILSSYTSEFSPRV